MLQQTPGYSQTPRSPSRPQPDELNPLLPPFFVPKKSRKDRGRRVNHDRNLQYKAQANAAHRLQIAQSRRSQKNQNTEAKRSKAAPAPVAPVAAAKPSTTTNPANPENDKPDEEPLMIDDFAGALREAQCARCGQWFEVPVLLPARNMEFSAFVAKMRKKLMDAGVLAHEDDFFEGSPGAGDDDSPTEQAAAADPTVWVPVVRSKSLTCPATVPVTRAKKHNNAKGEKKVAVGAQKHVEEARMKAIWDSVAYMV